MRRKLTLHLGLLAATALTLWAILLAGNRIEPPPYVGGKWTAHDGSRPIVIEQSGRLIEARLGDGSLIRGMLVQDASSYRFDFGSRVDPRLPARWEVDPAGASRLIVDDADGSTWHQPVKAPIVGTGLGD